MLARCDALLEEDGEAVYRYARWHVERACPLVPPIGTYADPNALVSAVAAEGCR